MKILIFWKWRFLICILRVLLLEQWIELKIILMKMMKMPRTLIWPIRALQNFFEIDKVDSNERDLFTNKNLSQSISKSNFTTGQHKHPEISAHFRIEDSEKDPVFGHRVFVSACTKFLKI